MACVHEVGRCGRPVSQATGAHRIAWLLVLALLLPVAGALALCAAQRRVLRSITANREGSGWMGMQLAQG